PRKGRHPSRSQARKVKITPEGKVKVLDFGLAKAMSGANASAIARSHHGMDVTPAPTDTMNSPTLSIVATNAGVILGTAGYTGGRKALIEGGADARYVPTGHLVYALGSTLLAVPFDAAKLEKHGGPVPVSEGILRATFSGAAQLSFAANGTMVYFP